MIAIFTDFAPSPIIQMVIGQSRITIWFKLPAPWPIIVGYYDATGVIRSPQGIDLQQCKIEGQFNSADGAFTWSIKPSVTIGAVDYEIAATPTGGSSVRNSGTF